ncbi:PAS-domain containing protein [Marivita sp. XM-24bin2]|jgi:signal transduction histidine kinase|uniref:hybrid sensor histidine kinase/response regulator n=1 Tax=unclassified Marivita TaxID=2632480 RepID=UPI000D78FEC8|nr:PAS-domain containing protein [Marivita sp. XM-24bin2]MCR9107622.1 PAS-domain containing protein [Paracoccaceae bacterium]PWL33726.1 MAG: hybrid sensor histidine kinase/response regulator [Marivita sp. XM-24bin2]
MAEKQYTDALVQAGLNLIGQALSIYDSDLKLAACNARFAEMFDLPADLTKPGADFEATIRHLAQRGEYGDIDDFDAFVAVRVKQASAFQPHYMERTRANGRTISVEGAPLPQGGWVTVYTDITEVKSQEQLLRTRSELLSEEVLARSEELAATNRKLAATVSALEEAQRELTEMEARTRLTTEMMPAHIAHVDSSGCYTFSNRRLSNVMPGRPSKIVGLHISDALGEDAYARVLPHLQMALAGNPSTFEFTDALSSRRIRVAFTPDESENGVYILSMDVTEETQARAALQQTRRREMAAQLTSGLAHDFSNLLTIILGMQSKLARMRLPAEADPLITATLQAARRGGDLLNRIADITAHRAWRPEPIDVSVFLTDLHTLAAPSLPDGIKIDISTDITERALLDPGQLQDSLLNLILNARDACGSDGIIQLRATEVRDTWIDFTLDDTGKGFSKDALKHALDPFFTTKGDGGSGLGLSMVYDMAKLAGGQLQVGNTATGARVTLRLPLRHAVRHLSNELVLLVEDSSDLRMTIRDMLTSLGHSVIEATSVDEALALARGVPDIAFVLSDISLEGSALGTELVPSLSPKPVYLMTSLPVTDPRHQDAASKTAVLPKPFTKSDLAAFLGHEADPS